MRATLHSGLSIGARVKANGLLAGISLSKIIKRGQSEDLKPGIELIQIQVRNCTCSNFYSIFYRYRLNRGFQVLIKVRIAFKTGIGVRVSVRISVMIRPALRC